MIKSNQDCLFRAKGKKGTSIHYSLLRRSSTMHRTVNNILVHGFVKGLERMLQNK